MININEKITEISEDDIKQFVEFAKRYNIIHIYATNRVGNFGISFLERLKLPEFTLDVGLDYHIYTERTNKRVIPVIRRDAYLKSSKKYYEFDVKSNDYWKIEKFVNDMNSIFFKQGFLTSGVHMTNRIAELPYIEWLNEERKLIPKYIASVNRLKKSFNISGRKRV